MYITSDAIIDSPVGPLFARAEGAELVQLTFGRRSNAVQQGGIEERRTSDVIRTVETQLGEYFAGTRKVFDVPIRLHGPQFHLSVWKALLKIPYGTTLSYGELAA